MSCARRPSPRLTKQRALAEHLDDLHDAYWAGQIEDYDHNDFRIRYVTDATTTLTGSESSRLRQPDRGSCKMPRHWQNASLASRCSASIQAASISRWPNVGADKSRTSAIATI